MKIEKDVLYKYLDIILIESDIADADNSKNILHEKHITPISNDEKEQYFEICEQIVSLGEKLGYMNRISKEEDWFKLTEKGIRAQELGGYFKYIEFIKNKELEKREYNIVAKNYIAGNNYGIQTSNSDFKSPIVQTTSITTDKEQNKKSVLEIVSWIIGIIIGIIGIYEFIIKKII